MIDTKLLHVAQVPKRRASGLYTTQSRDPNDISFLFKLKIEETKTPRGEKRDRSAKTALSLAAIHAWKNMLNKHTHTYLYTCAHKKKGYKYEIYACPPPPSTEWRPSYLSPALRHDICHELLVHAALGALGRHHRGGHEGVLSDSRLHRPDNDGVASNLGQDRCRMQGSSGEPARTASQYTTGWTML